MSAVVDADIRVVGLVAGTHLIEDISRDVPYGMVVVIPADMALASKDLWRAINQKFLYRLPSIPNTQQVAPMTDQEKQRLERYARELESHVLRLQSENQELKEQLKAWQDKSDAIMAGKLDSILAMLQAGVPVQGGAVVRGNDSSQKTIPLVDGSAPTFLPSEIRSKDLEARIDVQPESSSSGVSEAAERLRKMRNKGSS
jgi:hypothetical protein